MLASGDLRSGPRYGTDGVGQYETHGIGDNISAKCTYLASIDYFHNKKKLISLSIC